MKRVGWSREKANEQDMHVKEQVSQLIVYIIAEKSKCKNYGNRIVYILIKR